MPLKNPAIQNRFKIKTTKMQSTLLLCFPLFGSVYATTVQAWSVDNKLLGEISACGATIISSQYPALHRYYVDYNSAQVCWSNDHGECLFASESSGYINYWLNTHIESGYIACGHLGCDADPYCDI